MDLKAQLVPTFAIFLVHFFNNGTFLAIYLVIHIK